MSLPSSPNASDSPATRAVETTPAGAERPIRELSDLVAAQIAAGEVIERPAAVLKELLENALDAGARRISVEAAGAGQERICVHDDGWGIPAEQLLVACRRHATSKLVAASDLERLSSYGFRGEALPAIAAAAGRFLVRSRPRSADAAEIEFELGRPGPVRSAARDSGTTVEVVDLFRGQPARRAFLAGPRAERAALTRVCADAVLARPDCALVLELDGRVVLRHEPELVGGYGPELEGSHESRADADDGASAEGPLRAAASSVFEPAAAERAIWLAGRSERAEISLDGLAGAPQDSRRSRERIRLLINGRPVHDRRLSFAIQEAYQGWLRPGQFPLAVVRLTLPPDALDVNVHPAKTEVKLRDAGAAFALVGRTIREALAAARRASPLAIRPLRDPELEYADDAAPSTALAPVEEWQPSLEPDAAAGGLRSVRALPAGGAQAGSDRASAQQSSPAASSLASGAADGEPATESGVGERAAGQLGRGSAPRGGALRLPPLRMVGQLHRTFIIAEGPEGLVLVDQHGAHERVVYERLLERSAGPAAEALQALLEPVLVTLDAQDIANWALAASELAQLGIEAEPFGERALLLRTLPADCSAARAEALVRGLLSDLSQSGRGKQLEPLDRAAASIACHSTIRRGQPLDPQAMAALLRELERCERPHACPHGRPTLVEISSADVLRGFGRA